ncbi:MAG TPA: hypothetical protein DDY98_03890 [Ruminococcaceae bacterium]|nr:hypothetical protein [Oscillospiraceae bacterium]
MKKTVSVCVAILLALFPLVLSASATQQANVAAKFTGRLGGMSVADFRRFADLSGGNLIFHTEENDDRTIVCDCTGDLYFDKMIPGRTYTVTFEFAPAPGYAFADEVTEENANFTCEEGSEIVWVRLVRGNQGETYLSVCEKVCVPGTWWERIIGKVSDWILRIKAWSLY